MAGITTLMPTRGRPERALEAINSHNSTKTLEDTAIVAVLDNNDPRFMDYIKLDSPTTEVIVSTGGMVQRSNDAALKLVNRFDGPSIIGWTADDQLFRTDGWDHRIKGAFLNPSVGFVMTNDLHYGEVKAVNIYTRAEIVKALGWFLLPTLEHLYVDDAWVRLGRESGSLEYLEDVVVEHMHPVYGKAEDDAQYAELHTSEKYKKDGAAYDNWLFHYLDGDVDTVKECLRRLGKQD